MIQHSAGPASWNQRCYRLVGPPTPDYRPESVTLRGIYIHRLGTLENTGKVIHGSLQLGCTNLCLLIPSVVNVSALIKAQLSVNCFHPLLSGFCLILPGCLLFCLGVLWQTSEARGYTVSLSGCQDSRTPADSDGQLAAPAQVRNTNSTTFPSLGASRTIVPQHHSMAFSKGLQRSEEEPALASKCVLSRALKYQCAGAQEVDASILSQEISNWSPEKGLSTTRILLISGLASLLLPP